ncbi:hypothetical protein SAMN05216410_1604 [Sanguibacter gelidistatuariae]|uniref:Uncharacterized protein n=1 Tax=Sanguibacter gelidistatuariae TaxID=1814289 RepID=A0A1G6KJE8_9MICO|nr:hypothetical protein [Sanguibacter gelidistatuariae]SDC30675.1 hypothetical protein SAMN05216410_1604 [Sanguibacter gelidistatuariae]
MKRVLLVIAMLVVCGGIGMGVRVWTAGEPELEVVTVDPPAELVPLAETLTVDTTGMGTCPGFTVQAPRPPMSPPTTASDGTTSLATVILDDSSSAFLVVCLGQTADLGTPRELVAAIEPHDGVEVVGTSVEMRAGFAEVVRRDVKIGGTELSDRYFEHDGWLYVVGFLRKPQETTALEATIETILLSWTWS